MPFPILACRGPARRLLPSVIELIKTVNRSLKLGQLLCKCRSPDFLLEVIKKQVRSPDFLLEVIKKQVKGRLPCMSGDWERGTRAKYIMLADLVSKIYNRLFENVISKWL